MDDSDDIANLFKQFGGRPDEYQELGRANEAKLSRERWPLLTSIEATQARHAPPVQSGPGARPADPAPAPAPPEAPAPAPEQAAARPAFGAFRAAAAAAPVPPAPQPPAAPAPAPIFTARAEPHLSFPPAPPVPQPAAASMAPPAKPKPKAEFIPPRPRTSALPQARRDANVQPSPLNRIDLSQTAPVPSAAPAAAPAPAAASAPTATPAAAEESHDLHALFNRLAQPPSPPQETASPDRNATLLQRLRRL